MCLIFVNSCFSSSSKNVTSSFKPSYWHNPGTEPLTCLTVGQLIQQASEKYGDKEAVVSVYQNHRLTFRELHEQADKFAAGLLEIGLVKGDRVGIWSPNSSEWCIVSSAVARAGLVLVNINPAFQSSELEYCLHKVGIKTLITASTFKSQNYHKLLLNVLPELSRSSPGDFTSEKLPTFKSHIIISDDKFPGSFRYKDVIEFGNASSLERVKAIQDDIQPDEGWNVQFTSGTTGSAKATLLSHHNTINNSYGIGKRFELHKKHHKICLQVPLFHCFGSVIGLSAALHHGSTVVLPSPHFNAEDSLKAIQKERCTVLFGTPTMHVDMLSTVRQSKVVPDSLETVVTGGAPCSEHLCHELYGALKVKRICSVFGMTELSPVSFQTLPTDSLEQITKTVGYLSDHLEAKVIDTDGNIVPMGTPGEICIRGYSTMLKYFNDEESTKAMIGNDRWLRTGDQVVLLEDGYARVVGRLKDMIIRGGENIFPKEIEDFFQTHPYVLEAQVFGVPDYRMGEEICCCLTVKDGSTITEQDLKDYCKGKISHFKVPKYFEFVKEFPKTTSGKIQKFKLKEKFLQGINKS